MKPLATRLSHGGIIAGAVSAFSRLGFGAARVEDILDAAGVARRTFYKYFTSKEDVLVAVYELATSELLRAVQGDDMPGEDRSMKAIHRGLDVYLDYHVENAALLRVLVGQALRVDSPLFPARVRFRRELVRLLDDAVRASTGERNDAMLYGALVSALEGLSLDLLTTGASAAEVERAKKAMHQLLARTLEAAHP